MIELDGVRRWNGNYTGYSLQVQELCVIELDGVRRWNGTYTGYSLQVQELCVTELDGVQRRNGNYTGGKFTVMGQFATLIKPDLDLNAPEGMTTYSFSKSLVMDMSVLLQEVPAPDSPNSLKCKLCTKTLPLESMREHVAHQILTDGLVGCCRYCGGNSCNSFLKKTSRRMGKQYYRIESNCTYFVKLSKTPKNFTRNVNCTNHCTVDCVLRGPQSLIFRIIFVNIMRVVIS